MEAVGLAEKGELDKALALFNKVLELKPNEATSYNNRAQLLRLQGDVEGLFNIVNAVSFETFIFTCT